MKKFLIVILNFILASSLYADAFKLMGGLNLSRYAGSPKTETSDLSYKTGLCVGGGFEIGLSEKIAIEVDWFLLQKGSKVKFLTFPDLKSKYNLKTISVPVLAEIKFKRDLPFYFLGGGEFSLILSHTFEKKIGKNVDRQDLKENTKSFDFGLVFGCGFEVGISKFQSFFIEGRYHLGFANIAKEYDQYQSIKTNVILFILGIKSY